MRFALIFFIPLYLFFAIFAKNNELSNQSTNNTTIYLLCWSEKKIYNFNHPLQVLPLQVFNLEWLV